MLDDKSLKKNIQFFNTTHSAGGGASEMSQSLFTQLSQILTPKEFELSFYSRSSENSVPIYYRIKEKLPSLLARKRKNVIWSNGISGTHDTKVQFNGDLVHLNWINNSFLSLKKLEEIQSPIIWTLHDLWPITGGCHIPGSCNQYGLGCNKCPKLRLSFFQNLSSRNFIKKKNLLRDKEVHWVAPSLFIKKLAEVSLISENHKIHHIPNGIDLNIFPWVEKQNKKPLNLLFGAPAWDIDPNKGAHYLKELLRKLDEMSIPFILKTFGERLKVKLHENHQPLGWLNQNELAVTYAQADAFLLFSQWESFGLSSIEAQACGTPVLAWKGHGTEDTIQNEKTGFLMEMGDLDEVCNKLNVLKGKLSEMSENCCIARETFSIQNSALQYKNLYQKVLGV